MGMLDALALGALSGAGNGVADAASDAQRMNLEVQKQNQIQQNQIANVNADQSATGKIFANAFEQAAGFRYGDLPVQPAAANQSPADQPLSPTMPVTQQPQSNAPNGAPAATTQSPTQTPAQSTDQAPANPKGMMTPDVAASYRKGLLAAAEALMEAGKMKEGSDVMANLEHTYHTMGYAGSQDMLTNETITGQAANMKAEAAMIRAQQGKPLTPEEQQKLQAQTEELKGKQLEHQINYLKPIFGDDSTYSKLLSSPDAMMNKDAVNKQIEDGRTGTSAALELAQKGMPIETAASLVKSYMSGMAKVFKDPTGGLNIDIGNNQGVRLPLALQNYPVTPMPNIG